MRQMAYNLIRLVSEVFITHFALRIIVIAEKDFASCFLHDVPFLVLLEKWFLFCLFGRESVARFFCSQISGHYLRSLRCQYKTVFE